ncbi:MAG: tetratricopeptide repeat protein [Acidobacteria bacterium]|jgi:tetratricopeptide (TPR) repeat protein|nr:tetratricopeptide repeat protein [Acidobacteriota bacterium]MCU0253659.1 tetratricopeptide repeat protein [Acidobacteriota bacterium]
MFHHRSGIRGALRSFAVASSIGAAAIGAASAQETLRIAGDVVNQANEPIVGAEVLLAPAANGQLIDGGVPQRAKSNKKGHFTIAFARPGEYLMSVTAPDLVLTKLSMKIRDASKKPMTMADGTNLTDIVDAAVDPSRREIPIAIPKNAFYVDLVLGLAPPQAAPRAAARAADPAAVAAEASLKELMKARDDLIAGNFDAVVTEIDTVLEKKETIKDPRDLAIAYYMKGYALFKLGRAAEADAALAEAIAADPTMGDAYVMRAGVLVEQKKFDEASEAFRKALELNTDPARRPALLGNLGKALIEAGKVDQAVPYLEEALALAPDDVDVIVNLVDVYTRLGRTEDAAKLVSPNLPPKDAATLEFNIAASLANAKDFAAAEEHFRKVIALDPTLVSAQRYLGDVLLAQEKREAAIAEFEKYLQIQPNAEDAAEVKQMIDALKKSLPKSGGAKKK